MGASCCSNPKQADQAQVHDHNHAHDNRECQQSSDIDSTISSTCCGAEEHCDEKCIYAIAAAQCQGMCDGDPGREVSTNHPHEHDTDGGHITDSACDTHIQAAFAKYSNYLAQLRCICRSAIESGGITPLNICCAAKKPKPPGNKHIHSNCSHNRLDATIELNRRAIGHSSNTVDLEKPGTTEAVNFLVSGMDCTSCADKLMRVFSSIAGVSQPHVNFVMGTGDFRVDRSVTNADEVIRRSTVASGFALSKVVGGTYFLDVLASPADRRLLVNDPPQGVTDFQALDKLTLRLSYDPDIVGARDLLDSLTQRCQGLAPICADPQLQNSRRRLWDQLIKTVVAAALTVPVATVSWGSFLIDDGTSAVMSLALATLVQAIAVPEFYCPAASALWHSRTFEMDMLVVMSITAAYVYSVVAFAFQMAGTPLDEGHFFETSTMLITLILVGRLIAAFARVQAVAAVSMRSKQGNTALLITNAGDREIDARLLQQGDQFKLLPHHRIPTDGLVISGESEVDESMLTGESLPVANKKGSKVIAGTINGDGVMVVQLTRLPGNNTVTDIARLVEEAANSNPKIQDLANKVAGWFVPSMAAIAAVVLAVWLAIGIRGQHYSAGRSIRNSITYAVATLAVACPCALGLAVPMVLVVAGGIAAKGGVIIKSAETTESARKTTDVVLDKTGTITEDELAVEEQKTLLPQARQELIAVVKALVAGGKHPVSSAVDKHLEQQVSGPLPDVRNIRAIPGAGIQAEYEGTIMRAGNARWTNTEALAEVMDLQQAGLTTLIVTRDCVPIAVFGLAAKIRREAVSVISMLRARDITVHLVSGDQALAAEAVAAAVGISQEHVIGGCTPNEKRDYVASLMQDGLRRVIFCGDGTNDAGAVAQAHVGIHMGGGLGSSDITQGAADVVLLKGLGGIPFLLDISRASFHRMAFNFIWSAVYNVLAVTMASGAWVKFRIPPAYAGLGEMVSVIPVILAATSLLLARIRQDANSAKSELSRS